MRTLAVASISLAMFFMFACSSSSNETDSGSCSVGSCSTDLDCTRGHFCDDNNCCQEGCAVDGDCEEGVCNQDTHKCEGSGNDGGTDAGGNDAGENDAGGNDAGENDAGGNDAGGGDLAGDQGGGDLGGDEGTDGGGGDQGGDETECPATFDKTLGEDCVCSDECEAQYPHCFSDMINDPGPMYCTIADCVGGDCPTDYICNSAYTGADPPQPAFCMKCLGGAARAMGEDCLCDSDCDVAAPECIKGLGGEEEALPICTTTGCETGELDDCPGIFECATSFDIETQASFTYCKECTPGDQSLAAGALCGCNKDCVEGAMCLWDSDQSAKACQVCLGGDPRGFGETCECDADCGEEFPTCLVLSKYCSVFGCNDDPSLCPVDAVCHSFLGFCQIPE